MSNILQSNDSNERMPFVRFERVPEEDKAASLAAGHYVAKDIDMALITPPYSKDIMKYRVAIWFDQLKTDVMNERIPAEWVDKYRAAYEAFQKGQELPLDGIPIKGWGVISPAQQETLIKMHILTVEQLAAVTHEGLTRIGMGSIDLKNKADAWLKQLKKAGSVTIENATLKKKVDDQEATIALMEAKIADLSRLVESAVAQQPTHIGAVVGISADDLMDND